MNRGNLSRRGFMARSLAGLAAAGLPMWYARETLANHLELDAAQQPNNEIVMGAIGTGPQGQGIMMAARGQQGLRSSSAE